VEASRDKTLTQPPPAASTPASRCHLWAERSRVLIIQRRFIVVSGLPASGKSTLARQLAPAFGLPLYDKDDILAALFDMMGPVDADLRQRLSVLEQLGAAPAE